MKPINNFNEVQASAGDFARPTAGGYIIGILDVEDVPLDANTGKGDYLKIYYDIVYGNFAGYYSDLHSKFGGDYKTCFVKSYKEKALGMFKHFTNCVEESNQPYKWDWNEKGLKGRMLGVVLGEEEYLKNDGSIASRLYVKDIKTVEQIKNGDFKIPAIKKLTVQAAASRDFQVVEDLDELPFS